MQEGETMRKLLSLTLFTLFLVSHVTLGASADTGNPYIWIEDESGNIRDIFNIGEKLTIIAFSSTVPYDVKLYDPDDELRKSWSSDTEDFDSGLLDYATDKLGAWRVEIEDNEGKSAVGMYNVLAPKCVGGEMIMFKEKLSTSVPISKHAWLGVLLATISTVSISVAYIKHKKGNNFKDLRR